jgi:hypothetical protein
VVQFAVDVLPGFAQHHEFHVWRPVARQVAGRTAPVKPARTSDGFVSYSARKPYVVAERLEELCGPTQGTITLPPHLDWSGNATYDLGKPARLASMYRSVLNEAGSAEDLRAWLDARLLAQLWPTLWLPGALRRVWEEHFPHLGALRARTV